MEASLYVHVPFCSQKKCDYCDFYSAPVNLNDVRRGTNKQLASYVETLLLEAEKFFTANQWFKAALPENVPTVYIGGGTPSVLGSDGIKRLLGGLLQIIERFSPPPKEITVEANPESASEAFLAAAREAGATRLSMGIQTFHSPSRLAVNRTLSDESMLHERLDLASQYFPLAFSADLLSGLPLQDEKILAGDIKALLSHKPAHVSLYALTLEDGTALARKLDSGLVQLPEADKADALWLKGRDLLEKSGYGQYEVSNFCLAGKESLHNIRYWRMENWLALGSGGSGTLIDDESGTGLRYTNPKEITSNLPDAAIEELDQLTLMRETFLMGFRYIKGPDESLFRRRFKKGIEDIIPETLETWRSRGLAQKDKPALTRDGLLLLNRFLLEALEEVENILQKNAGFFEKNAIDLFGNP